MIDLMWHAALRGGGIGGVFPRKTVENPDKPSTGEE